MWHSPLFTPDKRGLTPKSQALNSLEFLHGWAQNDLVNIHVSRLLNCEGDSSSDRFGGNCMLVEVHYEIAALLVGAAEFQFGVHGARFDSRGADAATDFVTQSFGDSPHSKLGAAVHGATRLNTFRPATDAMLMK